MTFRAIKVEALSERVVEAQVAEVKVTGETGVISCISSIVGTGVKATGGSSIIRETYSGSCESCNMLGNDGL